MDLPKSPAELATRLDAVDYLADDGLATAAFLALRMGRPLFVEGEAGVGKTALAQALADALDAPLIRLQCYEGLDAAQALYDWDFPRQLLHLRAAEAVGVDDAERLEHELYDRRFLVARPLLQAVEASTAQRPAVLLVTRSTAPTTSSRRSCSRSSATSPSRSPSSARSAPPNRRSWWSPRTGPGRCTTR